MREPIYKKEKGILATNAVVIYDMLKEYFSRIGDDEKRDFWEYFSTKVYLLPIVLSDMDINKARSKALTIFETINI